MSLIGGKGDGRPVAPEGVRTEATQLAVREEVQSFEGRRMGIHPSFGIIWCLMGSVLVPLMPVVACFVVGVGAAVVVGTCSLRTSALVGLVSLASCGSVTAWLVGLTDLPLALLSVLCAFVLSFLAVRGKMSTSAVVLMASCAALVMIGADTVRTHQAGSTMTQVMTKLIDQAVEMSIGGTDIEGMAALMQTRDELIIYWPTLYFAVAAAIVACSFFGACRGARLAGVPVPHDVVARYDVPLGVAVLFALGVAADLAGSYLPADGDIVSRIGANVVMMCRFALAQQGLSVLRWWMDRRRAPGIVRVSSILAALWLELSFALTSVAGLLDVAVNFRGMERNRPSISFGPARER